MSALHIDLKLQEKMTLPNDSQSMKKFGNVFKKSPEKIIKHSELQQERGKSF